MVSILLISGWNIDESSTLIKYSKIGIGIAFLIYAYLLTIIIIYK